MEADERIPFRDWTMTYVYMDNPNINPEGVRLRAGRNKR